MDSNSEKPGDQASLSLDGAKRVRHAVLHSAGHAVDKAMVATAGAGVFSPSKGYHFEDSPYVEYLGVLPDGMDKTTFQGKVRPGGEKGNLGTAPLSTLLLCLLDCLEVWPAIISLLPSVWLVV